MTNSDRTQLETLTLERDHAKAETQRWIRRMTLLEARLEKIRELLGGDHRTQDPAEELPGATLAMLREAHRLAPPPFLPMQEWTSEARSAAADFYQLVHEVFPALVSRAAAQPRVSLDRLHQLILETRTQDRAATTEELIALLESDQPARED